MEFVIEHLGKIKIDSMAGIGTTVVIPGLSLAIDMGFLTKDAIKARHVAITHLHPDHVAGIHGYLGIRNLYGMDSSNFIVPSEVEDVFRRYINAIDKMQSHPFAWNIISAHANMPIKIKANYWLYPFLTIHSVPSFGYAIVHKKTKLKKEFMNLPPEEIAKRKAIGDTTILEKVDDPILVVTGDTTLTGILQAPWINNAKTLIVECTFLDRRKDIPQAHLGNHIHLDELIPLLEVWAKKGNGPKNTILYHISQLYKPEEAQEIVNKKLTPRLKTRVKIVPPGWPTC